jgi:hypothetical protein
MKNLVLDMDGTIVDFYGVKTWLQDIEEENARPYKIAKPLYNMRELNKVLKDLKKKGWTITVTSWLAKGSTKEYDKKVRTAKRNWLQKHNVPVDKIHLVKYGTTKANCTRKLGGYQVLVDDNERVRSGWHLGHTIDANKNIIEELKKL